MSSLRGFTATALLLLVAGSASAHHSATMFEQTKQITVEGVVKEFQYTNPHSWLLVDVKDTNGKVTMTGRPMKDGTPAAIWVLAIKDDGKKYDPRAGFAVK